MPSASDSAYPRLKANPSATELGEIYTPNIFEPVFAEESTRKPALQVGLLFLLKTFQRLGYFVRCAEIPAAIISHVARCADYPDVKQQGRSSIRQSHLTQASYARTSGMPSRFCLRDHPNHQCPLNVASFLDDSLITGSHPANLENASWDANGATLIFFGRPFQRTPSAAWPTATCGCPVG